MGSRIDKLPDETQEEHKSLLQISCEKLMNGRIVFLFEDFRLKFSVWMQSFWRWFQWQIRLMNLPGISIKKTRWHSYDDILLRRSTWIVGSYFYFQSLISELPQSALQPPFPTLQMLQISSLRMHVHNKWNAHFDVLKNIFI